MGLVAMKDEIGKNGLKRSALERNEHSIEAHLKFPQKAHVEGAHNVPFRAKTIPQIIGDLLRAYQSKTFLLIIIKNLSRSVFYTSARLTKEGSTMRNFSSQPIARLSKRWITSMGVLALALAVITMGSVLGLSAPTTENAKLTASDGAPVDSFGTSVAIDGDTIVVGAPFADVVNADAVNAVGCRNTGTDCGAVYVFVRNGSSWTQRAKLTAKDAASGDQFGYSVAISGDTILVGAYEANGGPGAAYLFAVRSTAQQNFTLTVTGKGNGNGTVTATGINCVIAAGTTSGNCLGTFAAKTKMTLTATPATDSVFAGWSGDKCKSSKGTLKVALKANLTCTARFRLLGVDLVGVLTKQSLTCKGGSKPKFEIKTKLEIKNNGPSSTAAAFSIDYFLSDDATLDGGDTLLGSLPFTKTIKGDGTGKQSAKFSLTSCPTNKRVIVKIDSGNALAELDETNNVVTSEALIPSSAGLEVIPVEMGNQDETQVRIAIFDLSGRKLLDEMSAGEWSPADTVGKRLANGVYLYVVSVRDRDGKFMQSEV
ncbi:hypothetical protein HY009_01005, partial [Candidatus Acetothermia bacterium]|nr:hypothetical protein [Candidatus Acetothermia bacterium]